MINVKKLRTVSLFVLIILTLKERNDLRKKTLMLEQTSYSRNNVMIIVRIF